MADIKSPNTLSVPSTQAAPELPQAERMVEVELLHDVWVEDKEHPDSVGGVLRIRTNVPVLDEDGNPKINKGSKTAVVTLTKAKLPISLAKKLIDAGKANRADPL